MIRSIDELVRDQADILAGYRQESAGRESVAMLPRPGGSTALAVFARVSSVVSVDATYGPHLLVVIQKWSGTPPTISDSSAAAVRCYPTPNHVVADYSVDETVRLSAAHGAMVAEKLA